ncbi:MAG: BtpA/SgcQ family protein [Ktedonobacteraceae bacterium]|nr:BtpA/SgcQ family protein [Ktedonobacteraceae bacterium]
MDILQRLFATPKPIIAMVHFPALPGRPAYDAQGGLAAILARVQHDVQHLQAAGVDGLLFCNEHDLPYSFEVEAEIPATMAFIIGQLREQVHIPFGVNILWDPIATIRLAAATGATFVREVFTGTYESDMGLWSPRGSEAFLVRKNLESQHIAIFNNITPEFAASIAGRSVAERARVAAFFGADALLISGQMAGAAADPEKIREAKEAVSHIPVLANTGASEANIERLLSVADGAIIGTSFKVDGYIWNAVDPERANRLMQRVRALRQETRHKEQ